MPVFTTEITSTTISSDNPLHQRLLKPYYEISESIFGDILEVGCGEGRGIQLLVPKVNSYTGIDKIKELISKLKEKYANLTFHSINIPPFEGISSDQFDYVVAFQVIEHIKNDRLFLEEIYRVLKPGGMAYITTPNVNFSLTRNPWHVREYTAEQLKELSGNVFDKTEMKGVAGNQKVMKYYAMNKRSVQKITRFDILNLQYRLPSSILRIPYEILNRLNRNRLQSSDDALVHSITVDDYLLTDNPNEALDLFLIAKKT